MFWGLEGRIGPLNLLEHMLNFPSLQRGAGKFTVPCLWRPTPESQGHISKTREHPHGSLHVGIEPGESLVPHTFVLGPT